MSGFSSPEFLLIVVLALVVLGPKRLPEIANKVGGWIGQARRMTRVMKRQLEEELNVDDLKNIGTSKITQQPDPKSAPDSADPAYDDSDYVAEADAEALAEDHIPNDDDAFSPVHENEQDEPEKSA